MFYLYLDQLIAMNNYYQACLVSGYNAIIQMNTDVIWRRLINRYYVDNKTVNPFVGGSSPPRGAILIMASRKLFISKPAEMRVFFRRLSLCFVQFSCAYSFS